jgi:hypothetical protein
MSSNSFNSIILLYAFSILLQFCIRFSCNYAWIFRVGHQSQFRNLKKGLSYPDIRDFIKKCFFCKSAYPQSQFFSLVCKSATIYTKYCSITAYHSSLQEKKCSSATAYLHFCNQLHRQRPQKGAELPLSTFKIELPHFRNSQPKSNSDPVGIWIWKLTNNKWFRISTDLNRNPAVSCVSAKSNFACLQLHIHNSFNFALRTIKLYVRSAD